MDLKEHIHTDFSKCTLKNHSVGQNNFSIQVASEQNNRYLKSKSEYRCCQFFGEKVTTGVPQSTH